MSWKSQIFTHFRGILGGSSQDSWKSSRDYPKRLSKRDSWRISRARGSSALKTRRPRLANLKFPVIWEDYLRILERLAEIIPRLSKSWRGDCVLIILKFPVMLESDSSLVFFNVVEATRTNSSQPSAAVSIWGILEGSLRDPRGIFEGSSTRSWNAIDPIGWWPIPERTTLRDF